jgi:hypothetical protein
MMLKWKLMLTTLPFVAVILFLVYVRVRLLQLPSVLEFSDTSPIITATALVIGFMLAGIMADYKEGEKLPGEMACALQVIGDCIQMEIEQMTEAESATLKQHYVNLQTVVMNWLLNRETAQNSYLALRDFFTIPGTSANFKSNIRLHIDGLRRNITRVDVIRRTDFIQTGYALLEVFVTITLGLLVMANFKTVIAQYVVVGSISLVYIYMIRLIRDLDNPFDYAVDGSCAGAAEVEYFPLTEIQPRWEK